MKQKPQFQLLDCPRTGPDKWATMTIFDPEDDDSRIAKEFDTLSDASEAAHEIAPFLRSGVRISIRHGEDMTYTIERA